MPEESKPIRKKLTVLEVKLIEKGERKPPKKGEWQKLTFRASSEDAPQGVWYFTFSPDLIPLILKDAILDCEFFIKEDEYGTKRNVIQIYQDGKPALGERQFGGRQWGLTFEQQKELEALKRASIEWQQAMIQVGGLLCANIGIAPDLQAAFFGAIRAKLGCTVVTEVKGRQAIVYNLEETSGGASETQIQSIPPQVPPPSQGAPPANPPSDFFEGVQPGTRKGLGDYLTRAGVSEAQAREYLGGTLAEWFAQGHTLSQATAQIGTKRMEKKGDK